MVKKQKKENFFVSLIWILLLALVFRSFIFSSYNIPTGSMINTLSIGDYIFASKWKYGYSKHSLPFSVPLIPKRIFSSNPERGDVVIFKLPTDNKTDYVKRVIGLPGDTVQIVGGKILLNGEMLEYKFIGTNINNKFINNNDPSLGCLNQEAKIYIERLPSGKSYEVLDTYDDLPQDNTQIYRVPENHYFMMGDNRDNSQDSRFLKKVGFVPHKNLVGKAEIKFFSWHWKKLGKKHCNSDIKWERVFKRIY
tara:strand:+ start:501 stop:1253 length:753 start_codon:yes stop_codon:yes gene_type:complete